MSLNKPSPFKYSKYIIDIHPFALGEVIEHVTAELEESGNDTIRELWANITESGLSHYLLRQIAYYLPFSTSARIGNYEEPAPESVYAQELYDSKGQ